MVATLTETKHWPFTWGLTEANQTLTSKTRWEYFGFFNKYNVQTDQ